MKRSISMKNLGLLYIPAITMILALMRGGVMAEAQKDPYTEVERQVGEWHRAMAAAEDRWAEKQYAQRNAEIAFRVADITPSNPDNAALLYYQAFLLRPLLRRFTTSFLMPNLTDRSEYTWDTACP